MEQRAIIKFHAKLGIKASEIFRLMQQVYGHDFLSQSTVFVWHKQFLDGRELLENEEHTGRPVSVRSSNTRNDRKST